MYAETFENKVFVVHETWRHALRTRITAVSKEARSLRNMAPGMFWGWISKEHEKEAKLF